MGDSWCGMSPCVCGVSRSSLVVKMREGVSFLQVGQSQPRSVRADKQLIAGGQRSGQLVRGWEATLVLKSGEWRGGRRVRVFREQTAPVEGDAVPYECGGRGKDYCWRPPRSKHSVKISEGLLGSQQHDSTLIPRFHLCALTNPLLGPKTALSHFNSSSALRDVTDCRYHPLPHHFLCAFPFAVPNMPFTNLVPDLLQPPTLLLSTAFARAGV